MLSAAAVFTCTVWGWFHRCGCQRGSGGGSIALKHAFFSNSLYLYSLDWFHRCGWWGGHRWVPGVWSAAAMDAQQLHRILHHAAPPHHLHRSRVCRGSHQHKQFVSRPHHRPSYAHGTGQLHSKWGLDCWDPVMESLGGGGSDVSSQAMFI